MFKFPSHSCLRFALPGVPPPRLQSEIATHITTLSKTMRIFESARTLARLACPPPSPASTIQPVDNCFPLDVRFVGCTRRSDRSRFPVPPATAAMPPAVRGSAPRLSPG